MPLRTSTGKIIYLPEDAPQASSVTYLWQLVPGLPTPVMWIQPKSDSYGLWVPTALTKYTNVPTPGTYDAAEGTAPAWAAATGFTWAALSNQYLTTGLTPANDQTWSMLCCYSGVTATSNILAGAYAGANQGFALQSAVATGQGYYNGQSVLVAPQVTAGCIAICGAQGYFDGVADGAAIGAWVGASALAIYLGALNSSGSPAANADGVTTLHAVWNSDISAYIAALYTVLQTAGLTT